MERMTIRPEPQYRTVMYLGWLVIAVIANAVLIPAFIFVPDMAGKIVFGILLGLFWTVVTLVGIWIPAYWKTLGFAVDDDAVRMHAGVFWKRRVTVPYRKITNVDVTEGPFERMFGIATVHVQTAGAGGAEGGRAELRMMGLSNADAIRDDVMGRLLGDGGNVVPKHEATTGGGTGTISDERVLLLAILDELRGIRASLGK